MPLDSNDIPLVLREVGPSAKGTPLDNSEVDNNFINLKTGILSVSSEVEDLQSDVTTIKNSNPWTPSNDGPGSGLDADTLDGKHLSDIETQITNLQELIETSANAVTLGGKTLADIESEAEAKFLAKSGGSLTGNITISREIPTIYFNDTSVPLGEQTEIAFSVIGKDAYIFESNQAQTNKIWHSGNDGSGSGLDADTLDGLDASQFYTVTQANNEFISRSGDMMTGKLTLKPGQNSGLSFSTSDLSDVDDSVTFTAETSGNNITAKISVGNDEGDIFLFDVPTDDSVYINNGVVLTSTNFNSIIGEVGGGITGPVALGTDTTGNYVASISGTENQIVVSGSGSETANVTLSLPQDIHSTATPIFAGATLNSISVGIETPNEINTTSGNLMLDSAGGTVDVGDNLYVEGNLSVVGNLTVNGTTITVNTTTFSVDDPIITLGGTTTPTLDDSKDRGIEFRWHDGTNGKTGFFGFDDSTGKFTFLPDATNTSEVFTGTKGTIDALVEWSNITGKPTTGTIATQNSNSVAITGGSITGITDLAIADGGTGASTAADARTNLLPTYTDNANKFLAINSSATDVEWVSVQIPNADVTSSSTTTDSNAIVRFDGTTGKIIKNSVATVDDLGIGRFNGLVLEVDLGIQYGGTGASTAEGARTNLGIGDVATQSASSINITGGSITGITDLAIADGGTGASTASDARTNLLPTYTNNIGKVLAVNSDATDVEWKTLESGGDVFAPSSSTNNAIVRFDGITGKLIKNSLATIDDSGVGSFSSIVLDSQLAIENGGTGATTAAQARANLGISELATQDLSNVTITGGSITGITDLAIVDGGTGASTATDARTNLGLTIGSDVQAYDAGLQSIANLSTSADKMIYTTASDTYAVTDLTIAGRALLDDPDAATQRSTLGLGTMATQNFNSIGITGGSITGITDLAIADGGTGASDAATARSNLGIVIGTNIQAYDPALQSISNLVTSANQMIYTTGSDTYATTTLTAAARTLLSDATVTAQRTTLGLGTIATQNSNNVAITGGSITGITDLAIADGGTGASTAADARTNLGIGTIATQNSNSVAITGGSLTGVTLTDPVITGTITEDIFTIIDVAAFEIDPGNGSIQLVTLGANRTPKATNFASGESVTLMILDGTNYTLTWSDTTFGSTGVIWIGGTAPALDSTKYTVIELWKIGSQVYGALVGAA